VQRIQRGFGGMPSRHVVIDAQAEKIRPFKWIKPQLTRLVDEAPVGDDWLPEIKYDGYRMHARIDGGKVKLLSLRRRDGVLTVAARRKPVVSVAFLVAAPHRRVRVPALGQTEKFCRSRAGARQPC
jgi:hypothetical protein